VCIAYSYSFFIGIKRIIVIAVTLSQSTTGKDFRVTVKTTFLSFLSFLNVYLQSWDFSLSPYLTQLNKLNKLF
jgi:hypothetical protein